MPVQPPLLRLLFPAAGPGLGHVGGSFQLPSLALGSGWLLRVTALIEDLKKKIKMIVKIVKLYLGLSLVLLWAVWGQFIFR